MGEAFTYVKNIFRDIGSWIYNLLIKNYYCETVKKYFVNISRFSNKAFITPIATFEVISPLLIPIAIIDGLARIFDSGNRLFSFFLEKIYLTIKMIFGEESFDVNEPILENEQDNQQNLNNQNNQNIPQNQNNQNNQNNHNNQQNQNNQNHEIFLNQGGNVINHNNIDQDLSENQPNNPNLEEGQNQHILDGTQNLISTIGRLIQDYRRFNFLNLQTYRYSFCLDPNIDNEIINNNDENNNANIIRGNSMVSSIAFRISNNAVEADFINEIEYFSDLNIIKKILERTIEELRGAGFNPIIMEDMNDGNGERPVNLEDLEDVSVIKMLIPINRNQN